VRGTLGAATMTPRQKDGPLALGTLVEFPLPPIVHQRLLSSSQRAAIANSCQASAARVACCRSSVCPAWSSGSAGRGFVTLTFLRELISSSSQSAKWTSWR
jgi:hypothetical protein